MKRLFLVFACLLMALPLWASPVPDVVAGMTLQEKVAQMFLVTLHGNIMTQQGAQFLREWKPGGVVLFAQNTGTPEATTRLTNDFQQTITEAGGLPLLVSIDQEGNVVARLTAENGFTVFPNPMIVTAAGAEMAYRVGYASAEELSGVGINMNLAPIADLETNPNNPIIQKRSYGSHPQVTGEIIAEIVRGTQSLNVLSTVKHFPGHGESTEDSHGTLPTMNMSRERIDMLESVPFRMAIDADVAAVMIGHLWFPALDSERIPATLSYNVVTKLLREDYGFEGLIVTDAMDMQAVDMNHYFTDAMVMSVNAGVDLLALGPSYGVDLTIRAMQAVIDAVNNGEIPESRIDESVRRIIAAKEKYGILDWQPLPVEGATERVNQAAHAELVADLFMAGTTVAYDHNNLIPLKVGQRNTIIFLATRYQIRDECIQYDPDIRWVGVSDNPSGDEIGWARGAAAESDAVVVFTQNAIDNREQQALVNALPADKTVAVAIWSPYDWRTYPQVGAYMLTYSPARPAIPAVCAILFGERPATGQLALTLSMNHQAGSKAE